MSARSRGGHLPSPATGRSSRWAVTAPIRADRGSVDSTSASRAGTWLRHVISAPPEVRDTHEVSSRAAGTAAIPVAACGATRIRTSRSASPRARASGTSTTRGTPAPRSLTEVAAELGRAPVAEGFDDGTAGELGFLVHATR